mgnify:CR=1 FL=1
MSWQDVGARADLNEDQPLTVKVGGTEIGIFLVDGKVHALEDVCPHAYALLSQGFVLGADVECPLHGAVFNIATGKCLKEPGGRDLKVYPAKIEGDRILVDVAG